MLSQIRAMSVFCLFLWAALLPSSAIAASLPELIQLTTPPVPAPTLVFEDAMKQSFNLQDFRGKFVILNIWASWCGPCVREMPSLDHLQALLGTKDLIVIPLDEEYNGAETASAFFKRKNIKSLTPYGDPSSRGMALTHDYGIPVTVLINAAGMQIGYVLGDAEWDSDATISFLKKNMSARP